MAQELTKHASVAVDDGVLRAAALTAQPGTSQVTLSGLNGVNKMVDLINQLIEVAVNPRGVGCHFRITHTFFRLKQVGKDIVGASVDHCSTSHSRLNRALAITMTCMMVSRFSEIVGAVGGWHCQHCQRCRVVWLCWRVDAGCCENCVASSGGWCDVADGRLERCMAQEFAHREQVMLGRVRLRCVPMA